MTPAQTQWARCRDWIAAAVDRGPGLESIEEVERKVENGLYSFWPGRACAIICDLTQYSEGKALTIMYAGGDMRELVDELEPILCAYARDLGCKSLIIAGRKGWEKVCAEIGYRFACVTVIKDLR